MIKNEKQFNVTKSRLNEFKQSLIDQPYKNYGINDPLYFEIEEDAIKSQIVFLEKEIMDYNLLKDGRTCFIPVQSLSSIPEALIKARIIRKWSQADLAEKTHLKEQQIQRYESCNYSTASIERINQIAEILEIGINGMKFMVLGHKFLLPEGLNEEVVNNAQIKLNQRRSFLNFAT